MEFTQLMKLYESTETRLKVDEKNHTFYKNLCFLSIGLAVGGITIFNISNGTSEAVSEASILTFIAGSLGTLYSKMTKDVYKSLIDSKKNTLNEISRIISPEEITAIERRKEEIRKLREELAINDVNYKTKTSKSLKRFSI